MTENHIATIDGVATRISDRVAALLRLVLEDARDVDAHAVGRLTLNWTNGKVWPDFSRSKPPTHLTQTG